MSYSNYRNNMPHYDSMPNNYNPMGIHDMTLNQRMHIANTMPTMPGMEDILRPFIPDTEIPFELDGDMPALPIMPGNQMPMPGMQQPGMPQQPQMPGMPQPGMPQQPQVPRTPQQPQMPRSPQQPQMPGMQQPGMPGMGMPGITPDGNMYPQMPGMPNGMPITCDQLREMMMRMNCPMNGNGMNGVNGPRPIVPPENGTATTPNDIDM